MFHMLQTDKTDRRDSAFMSVWEYCALCAQLVPTGSYRVLAIFALRVILSRQASSNCFPDLTDMLAFEIAHRLLLCYTLFYRL